MRSFLALTILSVIAALSAAAELAAPDATMGGAISKDINGDALPEGAVGRIGTGRFRSRGPLGFSADTKRITSVSEGWIFDWDTATGRLIRRVKAHEGTGPYSEWVMATALSGDTGTVAFSNPDKIHIWDIASGHERRSIPWDVKGFVLGPQLALSSDGQFVAATASFSPAETPRPEPVPIIVWNARTGRRVSVLTGHSRRVSALAFTHDGRTLLVVDDDAVIAREIDSGKERFRLKPPETENPASMAVSADGRLLALCTYRPTLQLDRSLSLFDLTNGKLIHRLQPEPANVSAAAFSADGRFLALFHADKAGGEGLMVYELVSGRRLRCIPTPGRSYITGLTFATDGKTVAGWSNILMRIHVWDVDAGRELSQPPGHDDVVSSVIFINRGSSLLTRAEDDRLKLWDAHTGVPQRLLAQETGRVLAIACSLDRKTIGSLERHDHVRLWDAETGKTLGEFSTDRNRQPNRSPAIMFDYGLGMASEGRTAFTLATTYEMSPEPPSTETRTWDTTTGKLMNTWVANKDQVVLFSSDGRVAVSRTGVVREAATGKVVCRFRSKAKDQWATSLQGGFPVPAAFSRDGRLLAVVESEWDERPDATPRMHNIAQVWELATRQRVFAIDVPDGVTSQAVFSTDGRVLMTAGSDGIALWDTASGRPILERHAFCGKVTALDLSPDGRFLATALEDTSVLVWDVSAVGIGRQAKPKRAASDERGTGGNFQLLWADLMSRDAKQGQSAVWRLAATPERSVSALGEHVHVVAAATPAHLKRLVKQLDSPRFAERDKAFQELRDLDRQALAPLQQGLRAKPSAEAERRIHALIDGLRSEPTPVRLREMRALQVLEAIATPEAIEVLKRLANGPADAPLTRDAKESLERALASAR